MKGKLKWILLWETFFFAHLEVGFYTRTSLKFWQQLVFQTEKIARKTLSVDKNFIGNINLGQKSRLNLDKFGIGIDILDCGSKLFT